MSNAPKTRHITRAKRNQTPYWNSEATKELIVVLPMISFGEHPYIQDVEDLFGGASMWIEIYSIVCSASFILLRMTF